LDSENFVWHLKKCKKFKKFVELNLEKFGGNKVEIFNAYFEDSHYDHNNENNKPPTQDNIPTEEKKPTQHMFITENYIDENEGQNHDNHDIDEAIKNDDFDKNNQPNKNGNIDFDVSKMSDVSGLVSEIIETKKPKNEKDVNCSLDLSDDG